MGTETSCVCGVALDNGVLLVGTSPTGRIYRSLDAGASWSLAQRLGTQTIVNNICDLGAGVVIAGTYNTGQVWRSTDYGLTWTLAQRLGTAQYAEYLAYLGLGKCIAIASAGPQTFLSAAIP